MKNTTLKNDLKGIVTSNNVAEVSTGTSGGYPTIEVAEREPKAYSSYVYKKVGDRDVDLAELNETLKQ